MVTDITLPVKSVPFFVQFCLLLSWFTSSCAHHLITVLAVFTGPYAELELFCPYVYFVIACGKQS